MTMLLCLTCALAGRVPAAQAENAAVIVIPAQTTEIEAYAFCSCAYVQEVVLPDGLRTIGEYAFYETGLKRIRVPDSVEFIGECAFPPETEIECSEGSYAEKWAEENRVVREPARFALLIGQEYTDSDSYLPGCFRDVDSMKRMLESMEATPYTVTVRKDLTAEEIEAAIASAFGQAQEGDVCLFYYSGHGCYSRSDELLGALEGTDSQRVTIRRLKNMLDAAPCEKIVILDSCYSGAAITAMDLYGEEEPVLETVNAAIVSVFADRTRSGLAQNGYYVMTAASAGETSVSAAVGSYMGWLHFGAFTCGLLWGCGYNEIAGMQMSALYADSNDDGCISLSEAYRYAYTRALFYNRYQHAQCYPENSDFVLWGR